MGTPTSMVHGSHSSASGQVECGVEKPCASPALSTDRSEEGKVNTRLFCYLCKIAVNSPSQLQEHNRGHSAQERTFHCEICNVRVNSEPQLKQHISSRRHRDAVAGKSNPLVGHHKSLGSAELMYTLLFHKDLSKSFNYGLLPNTMAVAAAATSSNQLALCTAGPSPHLYLPIIHTTQLNPTLLRPALRNKNRSRIYSGLGHLLLHANLIL
ncbi:zinc finger protein 385A-like isoform X3 [Pygocentrus nattereri]|uniref:zinc finger protein 385A-like isoform X3 n=1 Tax=Pygocentrus nattereri TaxID=42514 RepID=UPI00081471A6|nr:zinc finger protein 385A-like isoform X3 [Pygocentrus nattereri]